MITATAYTGRFAPSPSGPLHAGSLFTALASFLDARANNGTWLLRIEDIDPERSSPQWITHQQQTLHHFGLYWDDAVLIQSQKRPQHDSALNQLREKGLLYGCRCSRSILQGEKVYPGYCRNLDLPLDDHHHWRLKVPNQVVDCQDQLQPALSISVAKEFGDIILRRRGGHMTYHLAATIDDAFDGVTHVVRGADLWPDTPLQCLLQSLLGLPQPNYLHIPVLTDQQGKKLSKQNKAPALHRDNSAVPILIVLLQALGIEIENPTKHRSLQSILDHSIRNWNPVKIPKSTTLYLPLHDSQGFC